MRKDMGICFAQAKNSNASLPVAALVDQFYRRLEARGGKRWDSTAALIQLLLNGLNYVDLRFAAYDPAAPARAMSIINWPTRVLPADRCALCSRPRSPRTSMKSCAPLSPVRPVSRMCAA
jgi:hypothetical protein